jgi:hypothetical protein
MEIEGFTEDYRNTVIARIESGASGASDAPTTGGFEREFTGQFLEDLLDLGQIDDYEEAYLKKRSIKANAFAISEEGDHLTLVSTLPKIEESYEGLPTITKTEMETEFKRMEEFYSQAIEEAIDVDPSSDASQMIKEIASIRKTVERITFIVITGGRTDRIKEIPAGEMGKVETRYQLWTLERLYNLRQSGVSRELIEVDFRALHGKGIPCIEAPSANPEIRTFMAVIGGDVIADLYHEYRDRLLQKNVRCFLQLRGKVNKGIRATIHDDPDYFMPYNNGLTITIENMEMDQKGGLFIINRVKDLQIVNGGQTTASIWSAKYRDGVDVSGVGVQAKITWINDSRNLDELVSKISEYSNTQNRVRASDFSSNHPFHREMEELARNTRAPAVGDSQVDTYWFFERARGQFNDTRSGQGTRARIKAWDLENPRRQMFAMTDLAKFEMSFAQLPYLVSLGAQKCFTHFMDKLARENQGPPSLDYFKRAVAKAILFRSAEKIVSANKFGGYRAQIVTYTLAKIQNMYEGRINLDLIWEKQELHKDLAQAIEHVCVSANRLIQEDLPNRYKNPSEWAKKEACWKAFTGKEIELPKPLKAPILIAGRAKRPDKVGVAATLESSAEVKWLRGTEADMWKAMAGWAKDTDNFQVWQRKFMFSIGKQLGDSSFVPSQKQANAAQNIIEAAEGLGFKFI